MAKRKPTVPQVAAIYARYSSGAQNDASIEQQVEECMRYAADNGLSVTQTFEDRAISGRTDKRPGFQKMLRAAERGEFQVLLAYKSNRIARNMQSALTYEQRLAEAGVRIVYCKEAFDDNATGRFMLRMMMNMNQFYSENMSEDIKRGMRDSASKGRVTGIIPYGYKKGADGRYEIDEPAASIARGGEWTKTSFHRILSNERYTGSYDYGGERYENVIPAIIEKETFEMARQKQGTEAVARKHYHGATDYVLTGKLFCGLCLAPMVGMCGRGRHGEDHHYYACQTRRTKHACKKEHVRKEEIEVEVVRAIQHYVLDDDMVLWIADSIIETAKKCREQSSLAEYEKQLRDTKKQIDNLIRAIEMGVVGEEVKARMDELQEEKRTLTGLIHVERATIKDYDRATIIGYLDTIRQGDPTDKAFQKMVIRDFIRAVYLFDDHFKVVVDFTGENKSFDVGYGSIGGGEGFAYGTQGATISYLCKPLPHIQCIGQGFVISWPIPHK